MLETATMPPDVIAALQVHVVVHDGITLIDRIYNMHNLWWLMTRDM